MNLSWYALTSLLQSKLSNTLKSKDFGYLALKKNQGRHTQQYRLKLSSCSFRKVRLPPAKLCMLSQLTSELESFGHKFTPSDRPLIEVYRPKF